MNIKSVIKNAGKFCKDNASDILLGSGIGLGVATVVLAVAGTIKAVRKIDAKKAEEGKSTLTKKEALETTYKCYIPAAVSGVASIGCLIASASANHSKQAALATAYSITDATLREFTEKTKDILGEDKVHEITDSIVREKAEKKPVENFSGNVLSPEDGLMRCYDELSDRYFKGNPMTIRAKILELNETMLSEMQVSENDYFFALGLPPTKTGDDLIWDVGYGYIDVSYDMEMSESFVPTFVIRHNYAPRPRISYGLA